LLANLAYELMEEDKVIFEEEDLVNRLNRHLSIFGIENGKEVLEEVASHHGLLGIVKE